VKAADLRAARENNMVAIICLLFVMNIIFMCGVVVWRLTSNYCDWISCFLFFGGSLLACCCQLDFMSSKIHLAPYFPRGSVKNTISMMMKAKGRARKTGREKDKMAKQMRTAGFSVKAVFSKDVFS
jgi:hypothetical protein